MTGRIRNLRPFWSRRSIPSSGTPYRALAIRAAGVAVDNARALVETRAEVAELKAKLETAHGQLGKAADDMATVTEEMRAALMRAGYFHTGQRPVDLTAAVRHMADEYVRTASEYRNLKARHERLAGLSSGSGGASVDKLVAELDALRPRTGRSESADLEQERANNCALANRLEALRREKEDLEAELAASQGRRTEADWTGNPMMAARQS